MSRRGLLGTKRLLKPWGRRDLPASFASPCGEPVGEIWFQTPPSLDRILAKYLFTGDRLSVQIHPRAEHCPRGTGKDECWLVTAAEPGATLAIGFREKLDKQRIREAALDGTIEHLLDWREVQVDDFLYVPSGTVHAIGPGLTLVEVQQNTDVTYRLYDYGRPRVLHLDDAMKSIRPLPHPPELRRTIDPERGRLLVDGPYFSLVQTVGTPGSELDGLGGAVQVLPLSGTCKISGAVVSAGQAGWAPKLEAIDFSENQRCLLLFNPPRRLNEPILP